MSREGNCFDNAAIESFFGTSKAEYYRLAVPNSIDALKAGVHDYVHYYNHERIKLKLQGLQGLEPGGVPAEKHRLIGGIVTVQLLGSVHSRGGLVHDASNSMFALGDKGESCPSSFPSLPCRIPDGLSVYRRFVSTGALTTTQ